MSKAQLFLALTMTVLGGTAAQAGSITVTFDTPDQTGTDGDRLQFFGTIANTGAATVYLNEDSLALAGAPVDFTIDDLFLTNVAIPISLDPGTDSGDVELFDITIAEPFPDTYAQYFGSYGLVGGVDGNAQDTLVDPAVSFSVTAVSPSPEPGTWILMSAALIGLAAVRRRSSRHTR
jgi:hypothetical protein